MGGSTVKKERSHGETQEKVLHEVTATSTVNTYAFLRMAGRHALEDGIARESGSFYEWMTANIFAAFCLEAYLNHLCSKRFECWKKLERKLSVEEKLCLLLENLNQKPNFSCRPFQTLERIFWVRNQLAHGKTEHIEETRVKKLSQSESIEYPKADWQTLCNRKVAERFLTDAASVIKQLHEWAGLSTKLLFSLGEGSIYVKPISPFTTGVNKKGKRSGSKRRPATM